MPCIPSTSRLPKKPIANRSFAGLAAAVAMAATSTQATAQALTERAGVERVCHAGPVRGIARAQQARGAAGVTAAGVLPNPSLVIEHQRSLAGSTERETIVGLSVPLGLSGRRAIQKEAAAVRLEQATHDGAVTLFDAALTFREAYLAAMLDQAAVAELAEQQAALDALSATIQGLAKGGEAAHYDLLRQKARAKLHRRALDSARARARGSQALLAAWLGDTPELANWPGDIANAETTSATRTVSDSISAKHPRLQSLAADARAVALEARAARRRWLPDLELFAGYRTTTVAADTGHGLALGMRLPLTFFDHGQAEAARVESERQLTRAAAAGLRQRLRAELKSASVELELLVGSATDADAAVADARSLQEKAKALYAAGESNVTELLEAFRAAEEASLSRIALMQDITRARIRLMRASGTQFDDHLDRICSMTNRGAP